MSRLPADYLAGEWIGRVYSPRAGFRRVGRLGQAEKTPPTVMYNIIGENPHDKVKPMATLTLHYATREVLMARGIIPSE